MGRYAQIQGTPGAGFRPVSREMTEVGWDPPREAPSMSNPHPVPITPVGEANNRFRSEVLKGRPGHHRILSTQGIQALGPAAVQEILYLVLTFKEEDFREEFEPHGDRDFISAIYKGMKVWAKIDVYDLNLAFLSPDPADDEVTVRVLTLLLPSEY